MEVFRGDIYWAELKNSYPGESIQEGVRPVVIVSNDLNNKYCSNVNILPVTSKIQKKFLQVHTRIGQECGLPYESVVLAEAESTIPKICLKSQIGKCPDYVMVKIITAIQIQKGIVDPFDHKKAYKLIEAILDADKLLSDYSLPKSMNFRAALLDELEAYCNRYGLDYQTIWSEYEGSCYKQKYA